MWSLYFGEFCISENIEKLKNCFKMWWSLSGLIDCCDWEPKQNSIISRGGKISHKSIFFVVDIGGDFGVPLSVEVFMV